MRNAFKVPGFRRLYAGTAASMVGDSLMLIVMSIWVKSLTGSNGAAGLTFLWLTAPALLAPAFGYLIDRVPRRPFLVLANLLSALALLPLLAVDGAEDVWIIYAVAFCYGISFVVVPAALNGLLKDLVPEETLVEANASLALTREALRLVGPLIGASLFALWGGAVVAMVDGVTFLVAALVIATLVVDESALRTDREPMHWRAEVVEGARHIRRTPLLLHPTVALALCLLVLGFSESAVFAVVDAFDKPVEFVGPVLTVQGIGAVVSGVLASRTIKTLGEPRALVLGLGMLALGLLGVAGAQAVWQLLATTVLVGAGIPLLIVSYNTLLQKQTPGHLMGRVSTTSEVVVTMPQALSIATGALLVTLVDYRVIFLLMAIGTAVGAGYLLTALRGRMDPAPTLPTAPAAEGAVAEVAAGEPGAAPAPVVSMGDAPVIPGTVLPEPNVERPG